MDITVDTRVQRSSEPESSEVGEGLVLLSLEANSYFTLSSVGRAIWERTSEAIPVSRLCTELRSSFQVGPEQCQADTIAFLEFLYSRGLLTVFDDERSMGGRDGI